MSAGGVRGCGRYALEEVRVGRQKLGTFPDKSEKTLFGPLQGVVDASAQLSGECALCDGWVGVGGGCFVAGARGCCVAGCVSPGVRLRAGSEVAGGGARGSEWW